MTGPCTRDEHPRKSGAGALALRQTDGVSTTVLLVEDEPEIVTIMGDFLRVEGYDVLAAGDAHAALDAIEREPVDCVVLDVMLPGHSGFDVCRALRARSDVAILFLTAREDDSDKLRGLGLGADDYVVKTATPAEVVARVKAVLRRCGTGVGRTLRLGRVELDLAAHEARVEGAVVHLTAREFAMLRVLAEHPRQVLSRDQLFELVWGDFGDRSAVPVYVRRLREKLEADPGDPRLIVTVWGVGYRLDPV